MKKLLFTLLTTAIILITGCEKPNFGNTNKEKNQPTLPTNTVPKDSLNKDSTLNDQTDGHDGESPSNSPKPTDSTHQLGNGTPDAPFSVSEVLQMQLDFDYENVYIYGFIVGYISSNSIKTGASFILPATRNTNILIADSAGTTDIKRCIPVELPSGQTRETLNLVDHPENINREIKIKGKITTYFTVRGIKNTKSPTFIK